MVVLPAFALPIGDDEDAKFRTLATDFFWA
jgi:hypothetical protein